METSFFYAAAGNKDSSKDHRLVNEDEYEISRLNLGKGHGEDGNMFLGVFDGHGGGNASEFVRKNMREHFIATLSQDTKADILSSLHHAFQKVDVELFKSVEKAKDECDDKKEEICSCNFFMENPCRCLDSRMYASEGCTASVLFIQNKDVYLANVGDSDVFLYSFDSMLHDEIKSGYNLSYKQLNENHCPLTDEKNVDYQRISNIASRRRDLYQLRNMRCGDGIKRGSFERLNFVRMPGAHSLNMTRAFGNFGHKMFAKKEGGIICDDSNSTVVSSPFLSHLKLSGKTENTFIVMGSDGLWDNISTPQVGALTFQFLKENAKDTWKKIQDSEKYKSNSETMNQEILLAFLSMGVARYLVKQAKKSRRKPDDITVVVVLFSSILPLIL